MRAVMQPLMFAFVFAYVLPKIGSGFSSAGAGASGAGTRSALPPPVPGAWVAGGVTGSRSN